MSDTLSYKFIRTKHQQYVPIPDTAVESVQLINPDSHENSSNRNNINNIYEDSKDSIGNSSESVSSTSNVSSYFYQQLNATTYMSPFTFFRSSSQISSNTSSSSYCKYSNNLPTTLPVTLADYDLQQQSSNIDIEDDEESEEETSFEPIICSCCVASSSSSCGHFVETNKSHLKFFSLMSASLSCLVLLGLLLHTTYAHYFALLLGTSLSKQVLTGVTYFARDSDTHLTHANYLDYRYRLDRLLTPIRPLPYGAQ